MNDNVRATDYEFCNLNGLNQWLIHGGDYPTTSNSRNYFGEFPLRFCHFQESDIDLLLTSEYDDRFYLKNVFVSVALVVGEKQFNTGDIPKGMLETLRPEKVEKLRKSCPADQYLGKLLKKGLCVDDENDMGIRMYWRGGWGAAGRCQEQHLQLEQKGAYEYSVSIYWYTSRKS